MHGSAQGLWRCFGVLTCYRPHAPQRGGLSRFVALGGTSYAAIRLPANSVGPRQIKKDAVRSSDVKNSSLLAADFQAGQLPAGPRGPQGLPGARGAAGTNGTNGANGAPGPPGPTASSFASHSPGQLVALGIFPAQTQVISLRDGTNGRSGGDIVVPFAGRVFVSASLNIVTPGSLQNAAYVSCRPNIALVGSPTTAMDSQGSIIFVPSGSQGMAEVIGSADVGPGTYYVNVTCSNSDSPSSNQAATFNFGTLLAWAVAS